MLSGSATALSFLRALLPRSGFLHSFLNFPLTVLIWEEASATFRCANGSLVPVLILFSERHIADLRPVNDLKRCDLVYNFSLLSSAGRNALIPSTSVSRVSGKMLTMSPDAPRFETPDVA